MDRPPQAETRSFEQALSELERRVRQLDSGELALEQSLQMFEEGVGLVRECQELLDAAERRIIELTTAPGSTQQIIEVPGRGSPAEVGPSTRKF